MVGRGGGKDAGGEEPEECRGSTERKRMFERKNMRKMTGRKRGKRREGRRTHSKCSVQQERNSPKVVIVRRGAVGVLGNWKGWDSWVKGGANRVSLQAT